MIKMSKSIYRQPFFWTSVCSLLALGILIGLYSYAWVAPTASPNSSAGAAINFSGGNVGIGTTGPATLLDIRGTLTTELDALSIGNNSTASNLTKTTAINFRGTDTVSTNKLAAQIISYPTDINYVGAGLQFFTRNSDAVAERMRIDNAGNVGIGTTVPGGYKLNVNGTINAAGTVTAPTFSGALSGNASTATTATTANKLASTGYDTTKFTWYQTSETFAGYSGGWASHLISNHGAGETYYNQVITMPFYSAPQYSRLESGVFKGPYTFLSTENYSGYSTFSGAVTGSAFYYSSDATLKKDIQGIETPLAKIMKLEGVSFNWKETGKPSIGLIAQDVEKVFPEIVQTDKQTGLKSVEYGNLVAPLIEAVKEQQKMIDEQRMLINKQGEQIKTLQVWLGQH